MIYTAIASEQEPRKKLSPEVISAIQDVTSYYRAFHNWSFTEKIQPLFAQCEEKLGFINQNPSQK